jgi:hypothetical protein
MGTVHDILKNQGKRGALEAEHARGPEAVQLSCEEAHRTAVTLARFPASEVHRQVAGSLDAAAVAFACHPWIDARGVDIIAALANHGRVARASN